MSDPRPAVAVVLAAGQGTRMKSAKAKVLHEIAGVTPLLSIAGSLLEGVVDEETHYGLVDLGLEQLHDWLGRIEHALSQHDAADPERVFAAVGLQRMRLRHDQQVPEWTA